MEEMSGHRIGRVRVADDASRPDALSEAANATEDDGLEVSA